MNRRDVRQRRIFLSAAHKHGLNTVLFEPVELQLKTALDATRFDEVIENIKHDFFAFAPSPVDARKDFLVGPQSLAVLPIGATVLCGKRKHTKSGNVLFFPRMR